MEFHSKQPDVLPSNCNNQEAKSAEKHEKEMGSGLPSEHILEFRNPQSERTTLVLLLVLSLYATSPLSRSIPTHSRMLLFLCLQSRCILFWVNQIVILLNALLQSNPPYRITSSSKPKRRAISLQEKLNFCTRSSKSLFNRTDHLPRELGRCLTLEFVSMNTYSPIVHPFCLQPVCSFRSILGSVVMRFFKENRNAALFLSSPPNLNPRLFCLQN